MTFLPPVPRQSIPELLTTMDILYIGLKKQPLFRFGVSPNKLMDYMMASKPIVYAIEASNDIVTECGCGLSVPPENPVATAEAIIKLTKMTPAEREALGERGKEYVLTHHDYKVLAKDFIRVMKSEGSLG